MATAGSAVAGKHEMRMPGAQGPAGRGFERWNRELAVVPLTCNFDNIVRRIEQSDRTAARGEDPGGKTERGREYFFARLATLQQFTHLGQERGPLRAFLQCVHH